LNRTALTLVINEVLVVRLGFIILDKLDNTEFITVIILIILIADCLQVYTFVFVFCF